MPCCPMGGGAHDAMISSFSAELPVRCNCCSCCRRCCLCVFHALQYAVFGRMTHGEEVLIKMEELPTRRSGMFVMVRGNERRFYIGG